MSNLPDQQPSGWPIFAVLLLLTVMWTCIGLMLSMGDPAH